MKIARAWVLHIYGSNFYTSRDDFWLSLCPRHSSTDSLFSDMRILKTIGIRPESLKIIVQDHSLIELLRHTNKIASVL